MIFFGGGIIEYKNVLGFSLQIFPETFLILRRNERDIINVHRPSCKVPVIINVHRPSCKVPVIIARL